MIKKIVFFAILLQFLWGCNGNKPYNESADAKAEIKKAILESRTNNLPIILIFGANWCEECRALSTALTSGKDAEKFKREFKIIKVNVGNFDHNLDITKSYGDPIKGGIPGAAVISSDNRLIYVTKRGELGIARNISEHGLYDFFRRASIIVNTTI